MTTTRIDIQIRFGDVDMLRHVNNVNLQHYFDLGKSDFLRTVLGGFVQRGEGSELITASTATSYLAQTRLDDHIYALTRLEKIGNKSFTLFQQLINAATGAVHAESRTVMVAFDFTLQQPVAIQPSWREAFEQAMREEDRPAL
ncbi:thioesterase [Bacteroidia bacterium]|nr:thioesterase [Bacteroidia bacterium]